MWCSLDSYLQDMIERRHIDIPPRSNTAMFFHLDAAHTSYTFSHVGVCTCVWALTHTDKARYLDERQRLLSAADQRGFLLLLLLHNRGKGHQGGEGRTAHCTQHPGPEGRDRWHTERDSVRMGISDGAAMVKATRLQVCGQRLNQLQLTRCCVWTGCLSTWL